MLKKYLPVIFCCLVFSADAQNVQDVINAERSFAAYARDFNTRDAFLKFMDNNGVVFNNGQPKNAIEVWTANPVSKAKLLWEPAFAGIAASGEIGFTTGPWQFKKTMQDTAVASGIFTSIWRKNTDGIWKNIVDMGYALKKPGYIDPVIRTSPAAKYPKSGPPIDVIKLDQQFIDRYNQSGKAIFNDVLLPDSWLNMNSLQSFSSAQQHAAAIAVIPAGLVMKPLGGGIADSKDLAYVYGSVEYKNGKENYLRVWKQTDKGWKIILQVLLW